MTRHTLATLALACALPLAATFAADPSGQGPKRNDPRPAGAAVPSSNGERPAGPDRDRERGGDRDRGDRERGDRGGGDRFRGGPGGGGPGGANRPDWAALREQFGKFCETNAPERWKEIQAQQQTTGRFPRMDNMLQRYLWLRSIEKSDPKLYAIKVRQIQVEDKEYEHLKLLRAAEKANKPSEEQASIKAQIRQASKEYVDLRLQERTRRIEAIRQQLAAEEAAVAADTAAKDRLTDDRVTKMVSAEGLDFFNPKPPQRRPGNNFPGSPGAPADPDQDTPATPATNAAPTPIP